MKKLFFLVAILFFSNTVFAQNLFPNNQQKWVDSLFAKMTIDEKIGQLLMPRGNYNANYDPELLKFWIKEYKIGGLVLFAGSPIRQARLVNELQSLSKTPLFIGMDLEYGLAMRLDSTVRFPFMMTLGAMQGNNDLIQEMGVEIGQQCKRMGVHINYAPVVDVNNNPNNPVINFRSFGENKYKVTEKAIAYMKGLQSAGIITSAKHFPGHGDTGTDSHFDLPLITHPKSRLDTLELYPYKELIKNGLQGVMIAHLSVPALDTTKNLASTMSKKIITDLLRKELGFKGLVFTDAMDMKAATKYFPEGQANVKAILAGNDILETLTDIPGAFNAIKYALINKEITQSEIDERVKKILSAKAFAGLASYKPIELNNLISDLNPISSDLLNRKFAENTVTVLNNKDNLIPIKDLAKTKIATLAIGTKKVTDFQKVCENYTTIKHFYVDETSTETRIAEVKDSLKMFDLTLISLHGLSIRPAKNYSIKPEIEKLVATFATDNSILTMFSNLYTLGKFQNIEKPKGLIMSLQDSYYTQNAAAQIIFGAIASKGKLPATVNEIYKYNDGLNTKKSERLGYNIPEAYGIDSKYLSAKIDSIVNGAILQKATPGAVVLIAKEGEIIYQKAFGKHTYEGDRVVKTSDLYDLASITKIATSVPAFMKLQDEGKFNINTSTIGETMPQWKGSNKENLNYKDILTHQAKLKAWIPFWMTCIDSVKMVKNSIVYREKYAKLLEPNFLQKLFARKKANEKLANAINNNPKLWAECINLNKVETIWKPNTFSATASTSFEVPIAENLWMNSALKSNIFKEIEDSPLREKKDYVYSDLSYYLNPQIIKRLTDNDWETYLSENFYKPLGANSLVFNAIDKYKLENIVPTEYDSLYRKTLIHGRVHDEGASMLGGLSGHAGLFGNANDLAKLMQMYLNKGTYGGKKYIEKATLNQWTDYPFSVDINSRRGVGFDKADRKKAGISTSKSASASSFGHSGFTGTYTWVDPELQLVYVFLSNRVYPTRNNSKLSDLNVRTNILETIYDSIKLGVKK